MVAEQKAEVSNPNEAGQEVSVRPSHKHAGRGGLQLDVVCIMLPQVFVSLDIYRQYIGTVW